MLKLGDQIRFALLSSSNKHYTKFKESDNTLLS